MTRRTRIPPVERARLMAALLAKGATPEEAARQAEEALAFTGNIQLRRFEMETAAKGALLTGVTRPHFVGVAVVAGAGIVGAMVEWMGRHGSLEGFETAPGMEGLARLVEKKPGREGG